MEPPIEIPEHVRNKAHVHGATQWLAELPAIVADLEQRWQFSAGKPYAVGTEAYVCEATREDGSAAVLKMLVPREGELADREIGMLQLVDGDGCVRLLEADNARHAMLLERLGPSLRDLDLPMGRRHEILCDTAQRFWRPAPEEHPFMTGAEKATSLIACVERLWEELDRPCSEHAVAVAIGAAESRRDAHETADLVLVHGDVHQWNALQAPDGTFRLIDPDGLVAEAEYDLGILMREDPVELMQGHPDDRAHWLATRTGLDAVAIIESGDIERVANGLLCAQIGLEPFGWQMLDAGEFVASVRG